MGVGEITNLIDGDLREFSGIGWNAMEFCKIPCELTAGCITLSFIIGKAIYPTVACICLAIFLNKVIAKINVIFLFEKKSHSKSCWSFKCSYEKLSISCLLYQ